MRNKFICVLSAFLAVFTFVLSYAFLRDAAEKGVMLCTVEWVALRDANGNFVSTVGVYHPQIPLICMTAFAITACAVLMFVGMSRVRRYSNENSADLCAEQATDASSSEDEDEDDPYRDVRVYIQSYSNSNNYEDDEEPKGFWANLFRRQDIE